MILKLEGKLIYHYDEPTWVGGKNLHDEINSREWNEPVTFAIITGDALEAYRGRDIYAMEGYPGYSEWTPGESSLIDIGSTSVYLYDHNGEDVIIIIADEPVDLGEFWDGP